MNDILLQKNLCLNLIDNLIGIMECEPTNPIDTVNQLTKVSIGIGILEVETKKHLKMVLKSL